MASRCGRTAIASMVAPRPRPQVGGFASQGEALQALKIVLERPFVKSRATGIERERLERTGTAPARTPCP